MKTTKANQNKIDKFLLKIAQEHFFVETLEERKMDRLDFHDVSVMGMKAALEEAFQGGLKAGIEVGMAGKSF
jgi:hypothetical protein